MNKTEPKPSTFKPFRIENYLLVEKLGQGGMAEVYRGKLLGAGNFSKTVAIKKILPSFSEDAEFTKMFEHEAKLSSSLNHANIVQTFDFIASKQGCMLAMEYIAGKNLSEVQKRLSANNMEIPLCFSAFVISELCKGLHYAHTKRDEQGNLLNIVHRDVSPQNLILGYDGAVKLLDFGIAKASERGRNKTATGVLKGKFAYMAPEQASGKPLDHRTDIYCAGLVLFELLTQTPAIDGETDMEMISRAQEAKFIAPSRLNSNVPPELDKIVLTALSKNPDDRYETALMMSQALQTYLSINFGQFGQPEISAGMENVFSTEILEEQKKAELLESYQQEITKTLPPIQPNEKNQTLSGVKTNSRIPVTTSSSKVHFESQVSNTSYNWVLPSCFFIGLVYLVYSSRERIQNWVKAPLSKSKVQIAEQPLPQKVNPKTIFIPSKYSDSQTVNRETATDPTIDSRGLALSSPSDKLKPSESLVYFLASSISKPATIRVTWKDSTGVGGGIDGCKIVKNSVCPPELFKGSPPYTVSIQPYQKNTADPNHTFTQSSCAALGNKSEFEAARGICTLSITPGETKLILYFE